ncbi:Taurine hydroxylase-like protein SAT17 [Paramyrothecium foliicola]|nr:Taurine hydroxylase-like protein SAT17 [Paramyrothecium foliicola]
MSTAFSLKLWEIAHMKSLTLELLTRGLASARYVTMASELHGFLISQVPALTKGACFNNEPESSPPASTHTDISWDPSFDTYLARVMKLSAQEDDLPLEVPNGLPTTIDSRRVWSGPDLEESSYIYTLSHEDIVEINKAIHLAETGQPATLDPGKLNPQTFPLPALGKKLQAICDEIHTGQGFYVIRGLQVETWSAYQRVLAYAGVTSYIGAERACQDDQGSKLLYITDHGNASPIAQKRQAPYSSPFHTDVCDILAMHVYETAASGGAFKIASSGKIYNEIARHRPDMIHELAADSWVFDKLRATLFWFSDAAETADWSTRPILLSFGPQGPSFCYSRRPLIGSAAAPRTPGIPEMTERQAEAIDTIHFVAEQHELCLPLIRGDVALVNNLAVMHARAAFQDDEARGKKRLIARMWLRNEEKAWPTPDSLLPDWTRGYGTDSPWQKTGGWPLEPVIDWDRVTFKKFSCS